MPSARLPRSPLPDSLRELVEARLETLSDEHTELLAAAAVQGVFFDTDLLAAVLDRKRVEVLRTLASIERRSGLVRAVGIATASASSRSRRRCADGLHPALAREYHALLCAARRRQVEGEPGGRDAYFLAYHALRGGQPRDAGEWLESALEYLDAACRFEEYADMAQAALDVEGLLSGAERGATLVRLSMQFEQLGRREEQKAALDQAAELASRTGEKGLQARVALRMAVFTVKSGRLRRRRRGLRPGRRPGPRRAGDELVGRARGSQHRAGGCTQDGPPRKELPFLQRFQSLPSPRGHQRETIAAHTTSVSACFACRFEEADAELTRSLESPGRSATGPTRPPRCRTWGS